MQEQTTAFQERVKRLAYRFERQSAFAEGYSPLYSRLFSILAAWFQAPGRYEDPVVRWLVEAGTGRNTFDIPLLLLAGLHGRVLAGTAPTLAAYFPTAGGSWPPEAAADEQLPAVLRQAILAGRQELAAFIQQANVQTNETGRGLAWLLPLAYLPWPAVQLVDLGASAGLNLVADQRAYRLLDQEEQVLLDLGAGQPVQFVTRCQGNVQPLAEAGQVPRITGRLGCDLMPFALETPADELKLMSYVWGDQPQRLARLREGLAALHLVNENDTPVHLVQANLPADLPTLLAGLSGETPLVLYNTYMTIYLEEHGAGLRPVIAAWATTQHRPVLWLQWEPPRGEFPDDDDDEAPEDWCAWMVDLWLEDGRHEQWRLAWVHPHGTQASFGRDFSRYVRFTQTLLPNFPL